MRRALIIVAALAVASPALADGDWVPPVTDPLTLKECGSCHMAFQAAFLPARSWDRMMGELADHFGEDASLPADDASAIRLYLTANAGDRIGSKQARKFMRWVAPGGSPQSIVENPEFVREHRLPDSAWADPKVVTRSNCPACHRAAEQGWYDDD